jgi:hypothetical protein
MTFFFDKVGVFMNSTLKRINSLNSSVQIIRHTSPDCPSYLGSI